MLRSVLVLMALTALAIGAPSIALLSLLALAAVTILKPLMR
jgi:hypothetical protein